MTEKYNLSREALYDLIWSRPLNSAASECGMTMPQLRQLCLDHNIPLPWDGYKRGAERTALPPGADFDFRASVAKAINSLHYPGESTSNFLVPKKLMNPDPLIISAQNSIKQDFKLHGMPHMLRSDFGELNIRTSKANMERALRIMDTFVKACKGRAYQVFSRDKETIIQVRNLNLRVGIREITKVLSDTDKFGFRQFETTGILALKIDGYHTREWKDGSVLLENHIQEILDNMEVTARTLEAYWAKSKIREQELAKQQQAAIEVIQRDKEEKAAFEALIDEAQRWHKLQILNQYLDHLDKNFPQSPAFNQWMEWARNRKKIFDPTETRKLEYQSK